MLVLAVLASAFAADPVPVTVEGVFVTVAGTRIELPAPPKAAVGVGGKLVVLTAEGTVEEWSLEGAPTRVEVRAAPNVVGLFVAGDKAWAEVRETRATPVDMLARATVAVSVTPGTPAAPAALVRATSLSVARVAAGTAVVEGAVAAGQSVGMQVRFLRTEEVEVPSMTGAGVERRPVEREVAGGVVAQLEGTRAIIAVGRGGRVMAGDRVETRPYSEDTTYAPARFDGFREAGIVLRALLPVGTLGVALVGDAWLTRGFEGPWYASARLTPVAVGASTDGNVSTAGALVSGGYDTRYIAFGLGTGWTMLTSNPGLETYGADVANPPADLTGALSFVQEARLGARDGLHVDVRNTLVLVPTYSIDPTFDYESASLSGDKATLIDEGDAFMFGAIAITGWVPTGPRTDLLVDFASGANGVTSFEAGVHTWLRGNGDDGSVGLRVAAGYAGIQGREGNGLGGPMVSAGARYRF